MKQLITAKLSERLWHRMINAGVYNIRNLLIEYCSPTLAGMKTGSLFTVYGCCDNIMGEIRDLNHKLTKKGLRIVPVKKNKKFTLVYIYRPEMLKADLDLPEAEDILSRKGYCCGDPDCCLVQLVSHLLNDKDFPHEIGLFLGYPPSDVRCFMRDSCRGVKCTGSWKAYSNEDEARSTFERFKRCRDYFKKEVKKGKSLELLIKG